VSYGPKKLGRYEILQPLGQGAMGSVYKARDPAIDRTVAVKTVGTVLLGSEAAEEFLERFRREARAAGRLSHPHIVPVHDMGVDEATGTPFIVMEYVDGVSLATVLKENAALPVPQALEVIGQVASALDEAHRSGIVHRDVKPANVFLDSRGRVKVGDFGIAHLPESDLTQTGVRLGTPGYLPPEALRGERVDARSDVFALGALSYQVLTGRKPFEGATREAIALQVLHATPPAPQTLRAEVPQPVSALVMRSLSRDPAERPANAGEFLAELGPSDAPVPATITSVVPAPPVQGRRLALLALLLGLLGLLGAGALGLWWYLQREPPAEATPPRPAATPAARPAPATTPSPARARPVERPPSRVDEPPPPRREEDDNGNWRPPGKGKGHSKKKKEH
jgi:serine/threonine-protein kinase